MLPEKLLDQVETPARYIGGERNQVVKPPSEVDVRVALCYPDTYEVGMSHAGLFVLYETVNQRGNVAAERVFLPWVDAIALMRAEGIPLRSYETQTTLSDFDVVGITLQHELTLTNVLELLDLGGIPIRSEDRTGADPLVIGGGPCAFNPEPMADFFDLFAVGDGEPVLQDLLDLLTDLPDELDRRETRDREARERLILRCAAIDGIYAPACYGTDPDSRGMLIPTPRDDGCPQAVARRVAVDLDAQPWPTRPVVPWVEAVHDRAEVEIMRGCTRGCRFCQAGMVYRPARERSPETLMEQASSAIAATGYDELSLLSLNCPDYSRISELIDCLHAELAEDRVSVAMPSLRIDTFSVALADRLQRVRKSGLTLAPEAGSQRLRNAINKNVTQEDLLRAVAAAFRAGWQRVKLYFMMGLPGETDDDVRAIASLVNEVLALGRRELSRSGYGRLKIGVSVNAFIPKPHTPFQWSGLADEETLRRRRALLYEHLTDRRIQLSVSDFEAAQLEAALARGDRRLCEVIEGAWRAGAVFDAWSESFDAERWRDAFGDCGLDMRHLAAAELATDAALPWDVIDAGVTREYLLRELAHARQGEITPDCRANDCLGCGMARLVPDCPPVRWEMGDAES